MNVHRIVTAAAVAVAVVASTLAAMPAQAATDSDEATCGYVTTSRHITVTGRPGIEVLIAVQRSDHRRAWVERTVTIGANGKAGWTTKKSITHRGVGAISLTDDRECEYLG